MTSEYSIELQAENINNSKTRNYFQEVLSSYINGNYRSAIVVLWTVTVCDLIYKLQDLSSIYNDTIAEKILKDIRKKQEENKRSAEWERELVEFIEERTLMFATYEISHIQSLHQQRHLSAHPIIKEDLDLYQPNKETTRALIRNILESVLTKPSMASNKIFGDLIKDLNEKRELFTTTDDLKNYILPKYYKHVPDKVKQYIFKQLWKFTFKLNNEDSSKNRKINIRALAILYEQNIEIIEQFMREEENYFASNIKLDEEIHMDYFVELCLRNPKVYTLIEESYKAPIKERIKQSKALWSKSFFIYTDINDYLEDFKNEIGIDEVVRNIKLSQKIIIYFEEHDSLDNLIQLYTDRYGESKSFEDADRTFDALIAPILSYINKKEQFIYLLKKIEENNQIYRRGQADVDHKKIKEKCNQICDSFDYSLYTNFLWSIEE